MYIVCTYYTYIEGLTLYYRIIMRTGYVMKIYIIYIGTL